MTAALDDLLETFPLETVREVCHICENFTIDVTSKFGDITCGRDVWEKEEQDGETDQFFDVSDVLAESGSLVRSPSNSSLNDKLADLQELSRPLNAMKERLNRRLFGRQNSWHGRGSNPQVGKRRKRARSCNEVDCNLPRIEPGEKDCKTRARSASSEPPTTPRSGGVRGTCTSTCDAPPDPLSSLVVCSVYKLNYLWEGPACYPPFVTSSPSSHDHVTKLYRADLVMQYYVQGNELELKENYVHHPTESQRGF